MPGYDRTGSMGQGSRTGRQMGQCNPTNSEPNDSTITSENDTEVKTSQQIPPPGFGPGRGMRMGRGRGMGRGPGRGMRGGWNR